jgi:hypothetical protein
MKTCGGRIIINKCVKIKTKKKEYPDYYGLEMIIAVAFRVQSKNAKLFRNWLVRKAVINVDKTLISLFINWDKVQLN